MSTLEIKLKGKFTGNNMPKYLPDARMNKGSIALLDFTHPDVGLAAPPVTHNMSINNIAWKNARRIIGTSADAQSDYNFKVTSSATNNGMLIEFTAKKGLHGIVSQVNDSATSNDYWILFSQKIRDYIFNNIGRGFFVSIWDRKTRLALTPTSSFFMMHLFSTASYINSFQTGGSGMLGKHLGSRADATTLNSLDPQCLNAAFNAKSGTPGINDYTGFKFGSGAAYGGYELNKACSQILYQLHVVDVTASGMTYAQLDEADYKAWQAAFGAGGKFADDTFTNPTTLP
ncbi:hypothetical protein [Flectobacillus roseus]|uniref:hypothetical protein n=1 Tax=Flectobacillus roseus TaxID=502259 RepID=UPI0024B81399|nr:hypothetical protein [Flectobacillus roseus]MDI9871313.1 hypothetical protein [Flectobacillus roseus]